MKTIQRIIENHGGIENAIKIENAPYMPLCIEKIGTKNGFDIVSVAHYYEQNGDLMRDPEMTFLLVVRADMHQPVWIPLTYRQDGLGINQEAYFLDENGQEMVSMKLVKQFNQFSAQWDRNIKAQGYADVPVKQAA